MLHRVPAAEHHEMPGVGHVPMYDDPRAVSAAILDVTSAVDCRQIGEEVTQL
jgi:pimeloyl-ACP methyl ester carboxylesterase